MLSKVGVIGHFAKGKNLLNGQTVKTKILTDELCRKYDKSVRTYDTHGALSILKAPFQVISALMKSRNVVMLPAHNGVRVFTPLLTFFRRFFKDRGLYYAVVGGWLPEFLTERPRLLNRLKKFDGILVETEAMKRVLLNMGLENALVMPNCKSLEILKEDGLKVTGEPPYRLCTFSRVMKEKGIEEAVAAVREVNARIGKDVFLLDIYGQIDPSQTAWFAEIESSFPGYVKYRGIVPYNRSTEVLSEYDALLFPTYYDGEGMAGTVIDAMAAGVPVIASDWRYNSELVVEGVNGALVPPRNSSAIADRLLAIYENPALWNERKPSCLALARKYTPEIALCVLGDILK